MTGRAMGRSLVAAYGLGAAIVGLGAIAYAVGFLADLGVPKTVDAGSTHGVGHPLLVDVALLGLFGLQHSLMARPWFKARWTRVVPETIERSTYVLFAGGTLLLLMWAWRPLPDPLWAVDGLTAPVLLAISLGGWLLMIAAVWMIDMPDLLGLRQVWAVFRGRDVEPLDFQTPALYRYVRHPIMTGFLVAFWATPRMSVGHLLFAGGMTAYILVGVWVEERDLVRTFGEHYRDYRATVPMFVPRPWRSVSTAGDEPVRE